jgi:DNA helicase II / ATP-dependent DNA helicase PcrA
VLAGPGTGKTTAIIGQIQHLILEQGVDPKRILVITFSVATALDLADRLRILDPPLPGLPEVRTLHSYAFHVLRARSGQEFVGAETMLLHPSVAASCSV